MKICGNYGNPSPVFGYNAPGFGPATGKDASNETAPLYKPGETALTSEALEDLEAIADIVNPGYKARREALLKDIAEKFKKDGGFKSDTSDEPPQPMAVNNKKIPR